MRCIDLRQPQWPRGLQKTLFSLALENTPADVFRDRGIVWVIHLQFHEPIEQLVLQAM